MTPLSRRLRHAYRQFSSARRRGASRQRGATIRQLRVEALERRDLLAGDFVLTQVISADDALPGSVAAEFGRSVDVSGNRMAVGAPGHDRIEGGGRVVIFERDDVTQPWTKAFEILPPSDGTQEFGFTVAIDGDNLVVGNPEFFNQSTKAGSAFLYELDGEQWVLKAELISPRQRIGDVFGFSVDISQDIVVVGEFSGGGGNGGAYVFETDAPENPAIDLLQISGLEDGWDDDGNAVDLANSDFGVDVAIFGNNVFVGAMQEDSQPNAEGPNGDPYAFDPGQYDGAVHRFSIDVSGEEAIATWVSRFKALDLTTDGYSDGQKIWGQFGRALDVDQDGTLIVGASGRAGISWNGLTSTPGVAYIISPRHVNEPDGSLALSWKSGDSTVLQPEAAAERNTRSIFGETVAIDGDVAAVGSRYPVGAPDVDPIDIGRTYVFVKEENWPETESQKLSPGIDSSTGRAMRGPFFGNNVEIDNGSVIVAAPFADQNAGMLGVYSDNRAPVAVDDDGEGFRTGVGVAFETANVLANDSDPDGDSISIVASDSASQEGGVVVYLGDGSFNYTPPAGFAGGVDLFTYTIADDLGAVSTATVSISVLTSRELLQQLRQKVIGIYDDGDNDGLMTFSAFEKVMSKLDQAQQKPNAMYGQITSLQRLLTHNQKLRSEIDGTILADLLLDIELLLSTLT